MAVKTEGAVSVIYKAFHPGSGLLFPVLVGHRLHYQVVHPLDRHVIGIVHVTFYIIIVDRIILRRVSQINAVGHPPETLR